MRSDLCIVELLKYPAEQGFAFLANNEDRLSKWEDSEYIEAQDYS